MLLSGSPSVRADNHTNPNPETSSYLIHLYYNIQEKIIIKQANNSQRDRLSHFLKCSRLIKYIKKSLPVFETRIERGDCYMSRVCKSSLKPVFDR